MRAFVFTDASLSSQAGRFVWLTIDTEKPRNASLRKQLAVSALPSFFVVDPAAERVALRWVGGATAPHLNHILDDGFAAVAGGTVAGRPRAATPSDLALATADSLYGRAEYSPAAAAYQQAIADAPEGWPRYGRAVESLLYALEQIGNSERCARIAVETFPRLSRTPSAADVAGSGLSCAVELPDDHPQRAQLIASLEAIARKVVEDRTLPMAADDRSGVYISLHDAREAANDSVGALAVAVEWSEFLDGEAARAKTPEARVVFDSHRLSAYTEIGHPERAIPMLQASERDFPNDYNPPARLALAYKTMKSWHEALAASDRAMAKAYGPRKLRFYQERADIYVGLADSTSARRTLGEAVAWAEGLPPGQRSEASIASLKKKLAAMGAGPAASR